MEESPIHGVNEKKNQELVASPVDDFLLLDEGNRVAWEEGGSSMAVNELFALESRGEADGVVGAQADHFLKYEDEDPLILFSKEMGYESESDARKSQSRSKNKSGIVTRQSQPVLSLPSKFNL